MTILRTRDFILNNNEEYIKIIKERLSEVRFTHSINVAEAAAQLAEKYGADAQKAFTAGILHDITKEESHEAQKEYITRNGIALTELERLNGKVLHQMSGSLFCRSELGIDDEEILGAVRYHTTGRRDMTLLEKVVYTADFISAERCYSDVEVMREKAQKSLEEAMLYSLRWTIRDLSSKAKLIHPDTLECYNWILENELKRKIV